MAYAIWDIGDDTCVGGTLPLWSYPAGYDVAVSGDNIVIVVSLGFPPDSDIVVASSSDGGNTWLYFKRLVNASGLNQFPKALFHDDKPLVVWKQTVPEHERIMLADLSSPGSEFTTYADVTDERLHHRSLGELSFNLKEGAPVIRYKLTDHFYEDVEDQNGRSTWTKVGEDESEFTHIIAN